MKTSEEFVREYYQLPQSKIETVRIKSLIRCVERYKEYYESEVKKLNMHAIINKQLLEAAKKIINWYDDENENNPHSTIQWKEAYDALRTAVNNLNKAAVIKSFCKCSEPKYNYPEMVWCDNCGLEIPKTQTVL